VNFLNISASAWVNLLNADTHFVSRPSKMTLKLEDSPQVQRIVWDDEAWIR